MEKEFEVKILNIDVKKIIEKLENLNAKFLVEENQLNYNIKSSTINKIPDGSYLRIRELIDENKNKISSEITFKENIINNNIRENNEYNVNISDVNSMLKILEFLGYDIVNCHKKNRKSYSFKNIRIDIDTWEKSVYPYPYMEIEVKNYDDLYEVLDLLEINRENISLKSIAQLQDELKKQR